MTTVQHYKYSYFVNGKYEISQYLRTIDLLLMPGLDYLTKSNLACS